MTSERAPKQVTPGDKRPPAASARRDELSLSGCLHRGGLRSRLDEADEAVPQTLAGALRASIIEARSSLSAAPVEVEALAIEVREIDHRLTRVETVVELGLAAGAQRRIER